MEIIIILAVVAAVATFVWHRAKDETNSSTGTGGGGSGADRGGTKDL